MNGRYETISYPLAASIILVLLAVIVLGSLSVVKSIKALRPQNPLERARETWEAVVDRNPLDAGSRVQLGWTYYRMSEKEKDSQKKVDLKKKALAAYLKALELNPRTATAMYNAGLVYEELGKYDKATEMFEKLCKLDSGHTLAVYHLGHIYLLQGKLDKAIEKLKKAVEVEPLAANFRLELARAYDKTGRTDDAVTQLNEALKYIPDYQDARTMLERLKNKSPQKQSKVK